MELRVPAMTSRSTLLHSVSLKLRVLPYTVVVNAILVTYYTTLLCDLRTTV